jgi:hypothetical protein
VKVVLPAGGTTTVAGGPPTTAASTPTTRGAAGGGRTTGPPTTDGSDQSGGWSVSTTVWAVREKVASEETVTAVSLIGVGGADAGRSITLPVGGLITIAPNDQTAYVATDNATSTLIPVNLGLGAVGTPITLPGHDDLVSSVAYSPSGTTLYLTDVNGGVLIPVNLSTQTAGPPIAVGPLGACGDIDTYTTVTPDGQDAYIEAQGRLFDVDLVHGKSSPAFTATALAQTKNPYGDPDIALSPDGSTLWALQSGEHGDVLVPINTNGDAAGRAISVPVSNRPTAPPQQAEQWTPQWDNLYLPTNNTALIVAYGSQPEEVIPVNLTTGTAGQPISLASLKDNSGCGNSPQLPVAITADGSTAIVGNPADSSVYTVNLSNGAQGTPLKLSGTGALRAIISPTGYSDWTFAI